jgi:hypothetical protein
MTERKRRTQDIQAGDRLAVILAWTAVLRDGNTGELRQLLDEQVTWQGIRPELACHGPGDVIALLERLRGRRLQIVRLEAEEVGERVAVSVEGEGLPEIVGVIAAAAPRSLVFTFAGRHIVRMASYGTREEAFASLR